MFDPIVTSETAHNMHGVDGRMFGRTVAPNSAPGCFQIQKFGASRPAPASLGYPKGSTIHVNVRFDDDCHNGHNTFAIGGEVYGPRAEAVRKRGHTPEPIACGCIHDDIAAAFPELAHLIKWHLTSSDGPMHYVANAVYLAGDRDHNGKRAGDVATTARAIKFGDNPIKHHLKPAFWRFLRDHSPLAGGVAYDFEILQIDHKERGKPGAYQFGPKFTFGGYGSEWHHCPFETEAEALDFLHALNNCSPKFVEIPTSYSDGKARDLEAARRVAVWPEATDEELSAEPEELRAKLAARLPDLLARFRADIEAAGFMWEAPARSED